MVLRFGEKMCVECSISFFGLCRNSNGTTGGSQFNGGAVKQLNSGSMREANGSSRGMSSLTNVSSADRSGSSQEQVAIDQATSFSSIFEDSMKPGWRYSLASNNSSNKSSPPGPKRHSLEEDRNFGTNISEPENDWLLLLETLLYLIDVSKNRQGRLKHKHVKVNYENTENPERCVITLFDKYNLVCPPLDIPPDAFYLRPLDKPKIIWLAANQ